MFPSRSATISNWKRIPPETTCRESAEPYSADRIDRSLPLGGVQQWELRSYFVSHPFHIHVNPFQIVKIIDPNGKDVSVPGAVDDADPSGVDPQYPGLQGVWKDTLWIKSLIDTAAGLTNPPTGVYKVVVRTRYERYIGQFVLHCHILDHEDQGMMQNITHRHSRRTGRRHPRPPLKRSSLKQAGR